MSNTPKNSKGIHVAKGESALSAMKKQIPHWIHDTKEDTSSVNGIIYLRSCTCSQCGYHTNMEKPVCPQCKAKMNEMTGIRAE